MSEPSHASSRAWSWRHAVGKSGLPPMTRLVLHTLGLKMDATGGSCFPPVSELVELTGLDKKTVLKHLDLARENGWIEISKHGYGGQKWKRNEYTARWPGREMSGAVTAIDGEGGGAAPPRSTTEKAVEMVPEGGGNGDPKVVEQFHQDKILPANIPANIPEREGAGANDRSGKRGASHTELVKRVQRFVSGEGYQAGEWPKWSSSSIGHIAKQFEHLTDEEREKACQFRDAFLAKCKRDGVKKPMPVANYFRDRLWEMLDASTASSTIHHPPRIAVAPFGPVWAGKRALLLLDGPEGVDIPLDLRAQVIQTFEVMRRTNEARAEAYLARKGVGIDHHGHPVFPDGFDAAEQRRRVLEEGYPEVNRLHQQAKDRERGSADARYAALADLCEAVPVRSAMFQRWMAHDAAAGWPAIPDPGQMPVIYFPKGGPEGLKDFERAARAAIGRERSDEHAA